MSSVKGKIAIIGSGLIGRSWAMLFASGNYKVMIYDTNPFTVDSTFLDIKEQLKKLETSGLLRGTLTAEAQFQLIEKSNSIEECVKDAFHVQECVFEDAKLKKSVFKELDEIVTDDTVTLASSTSCVVPSDFSDGLTHQKQVLVAHPANPPYYVPIVEIVPAPWTDRKIIDKTVELMTEIGQKPVICKKEVFGFAINRMQYAIINECWRLVKDGVMSVEDVDMVMTGGLGMRYAFLGVFETCHLNADGMLDYCERYANGIYNVSETFGPVPMMMGDTLNEIHHELCQKVPLGKLIDRQRWRDERLAQLAKLKKSMTDRNLDVV